MKCEKCGENEANIHMKNIFNGNITEYHVCDSCAKKTKDSIEGFDLSFNSLLEGLIKENVENKTVLKEKKCSKCNMTYSEFKRNGRLGCDNCYTTFRPEISAMLNKLNGTTKHIGKRPKYNMNIIKESTNVPTVDSLKSDMEKAIKEENFELAATIRDEIKKLQDV